jgi:hypothetical protein
MLWIDSKKKEMLAVCVSKMKTFAVRMEISQTVTMERVIIIGKGRITHVSCINCDIFFLIRHFIREVFFSWISTFSHGRYLFFCGVV